MNPRVGSREERFLVIGPGHVGDLLRITPALEVLRRNRPDAFVCVVTKSRSAELLAGNPAVDRVLTYDHRAPKWYLPSHLVLGRRLRRLDFDSAFVFSSNRYLGGLPAKLGVPKVYEPGWEFRKNRVLHNLDAINEFGFPGRSDRLALNVTDDVRERVRKLLSSEGHSNEGRLIGLHVGTRVVSRGGAQSIQKDWPVREMAQLIDEMAESLGASVVLTGQGREREIAAEVRSCVRNHPLDLVDKTDLRELAALTGLCDVYVSPDTGSMHIAASQPTRLVALFGPTLPEIDGPFMPEHRLVLIKRDAMAEITAAEVLAAVKRLLEDEPVSR